MSAVSGYVDVYIWRGRNSNGEITTSSESITAVRILGKPPTGLERCGHVSMCIFPLLRNNERVRNEQHYISLWPGSNGKGFLKPDLASDRKSEVGKPSIIVRLHNLNIEQMINAFNDAKVKVKDGSLVWTLYSSDEGNLLSGSTAANCTSFVWFFLKIGGINRPKYSESLSLRGPRNDDFYKKVKCHIGRRFWGLADGWIWTRKFFTPYALSLRIASAAEAYDVDKLETIRLMQDARLIDTDAIERKYSIFSFGASAAGSAPDPSTGYLLGNLLLIGVGASVGAICVIKISRWLFSSNALADA